MKKIFKRTLKTILALFLVLLVLVIGYISYVLIAYYRIGNADLDIQSNNQVSAKINTEYNIVSWNIGFAAYSQDFSFFMDGGKHSRAYSRDEVYDNMQGITTSLESLNADFHLLQEVDVKATRSYKVDQKDILQRKFSKMNQTFAINYDSPYLLYPIFSPHGKSLAGMLTQSKFEMEQSNRIELPIEKGFMKFLDLDRCYNKIKIKIEGNKNLILYNIHLSAYTSDGSIAKEQLKILMQDMEQEYNAGNYVICGGDFNKDLLGDSSKIFGVSIGDESWALPFPEDVLGENFTLAADVDATNPIPSCRNCDMGYVPGETFVLVVDGFIVSKNIKVNEFKIEDAQFKNSDHNPVALKFELME